MTIPDLAFADRVKQISQGTGSGELALGAATSAKFRTLTAAGIAIGAHVSYTIEHQGLGVGEWEVGYGTVTAGGLQRDTVTSSSNAGTLVNFSAGIKHVALTLISDTLVEMLSGSVAATRIAGAVAGGTLPFAGTTATFSGNLAVDTNTLFVNAATNRVGILTTSPVVDLDVSSSIDDLIAARVKNISTHQYASASVIVENSVSSMQFAKLSTGYAPSYKTMVPNVTVFYNSGGNMAFLNDDAAGDISFLAGGAATPQITIAANGTTTFTSPVIFSGASTLTTPTIASFLNATHSHQNAAGGGTLDASAIATGTIDAARLPPSSVDWTAPGTIGSVTPNTVKATTLESTGNVLFGPAGASIGAGRVTINGAASSKLIAMRQHATSPDDIIYVRNSADNRSVFRVNALGGIVIQNSAGDPGSLDGGASWSIGADGSNNLIFRTNGRFDFSNTLSGEIRVPATIAFPSSTSIALSVNGGTLLTQTRTNIQGSGAYTDIVKAGANQLTNDIAQWTDQAGSTVYARVTSTGVGRFVGLRIDQAPVAATPTPTHTITVNLNGTDYRIPCVI